MFWGFVLEPKKRYNTTVTKPFHISMAALDPKSINDNDISSLVLNVDGTETILCNLGKPNYLQERLDLNFIEGNTITLEVKGKAIVHLSGYFIYEQDGMDDEDDSDLDDEEDVDDEELEEEDQKALQALRKKINKKSKFNASTTEEDSDDDDEDDDSMDVSDLAFDDDEDDDDEDDDGEDDDEDDDDEDDDSEEEEVKIASPGSTPMPPAKKQKGNNASANNTPISAKKKKQQELQQAKQESAKKNKGDKQSPQKQAPLTNGNTTPGSNKKKKNKENNAAGTPNSNAGTPNSKQADGKTPKKSLEGGVIVEDLKVGAGVPAKSGKMVSVYYAGKLKSNNKQFDATTQGPGFKFRLGKGEVIKGWDVGLNGMKVGGKRRITIPAHMAYGNKGSPPAIPPNSTLVFDVELKNVN
ncbi:hypothetical protein WDU94_006234 [Cyamophila willieti]